MRRLALVPVLALGCRYLAPAQQPVTPARPDTAASGVPTDAPLTANRCGIDCAIGFHCDEKAASCIADAVTSPTGRDAGAPWLP